MVDANTINAIVANHIALRDATTVAEDALNSYTASFIKMVNLKRQMDIVVVAAFDI